MKLSSAAVITLFLFFTTSFADNSDDPTFLIQGSTYSELWEDISPLIGVGIAGNFYINRHFSIQFMVQGDCEKVELSPGFILAPIGGLILAIHSGDTVDSVNVLKTIGAGVLMIASIVENPNFHIPFNDHLDLSLSVHLLRLQITQSHRFNPKAGLGVALNITPAKHLTISPYAELNTRWEKVKPIGVQSGLRLGWKF